MIFTAISKSPPHTLLCVWTKFVTPRSIVAATAVASLVVVGTLGSIGVQSYFHAQESAANEMEALTSEITSSVKELSSNSGAIHETLAEAQATLDASNGKTLDNTARDELNAAIAEAHAELDDAEARASELEQKLAQAQRNFEDKLLWPPDAEAVVEQLHEQNLELDGKLDALMTRVAEARTAVGEAQSAWQAEQDRIAAEAAKAAAEAAAKAAQAAAVRVKQAGPPAAPSVQPAPPANAVTSFNAIAFLRQLVTESQASIVVGPLSWCPPNSLCGQASFGYGLPYITILGANGVPVNYDSAGGRYVLVHEAAHIRQYYYQGDLTAMLSKAPPVPSTWTRPVSHWPIEYMADCSTQVKTGFVGTYVTRDAQLSSCTPEQLTEAARVW